MEARTLYTDIDPACCAVLEARAGDGSLPTGDVALADVRILDAAALAPYRQVHLFCGMGGSPLGLAWAGWPPEWSVVTGGFPCQDISAAGKGAGLDGARSGLFWEMCRVIECKKPVGVFAENVGALSARGLDRVVGALESLGYWVEALRVGAWALGSPQERERWWFVCRRADLGDGGWPVAGDHGDGREAQRRHAADEHEGAAAEGHPPAGDPRSGVADAGEVHESLPAAGGRAAQGGTTPGAGDRGGLVLAERPGLEGLRAHPGQTQIPEPRDSGPVRRWVHPRWCVIDAEGRDRTVPTPQHEWEPPRLHEGSKTISARWRLGLMGYPLHWLEVPDEVIAGLAPKYKTPKRRAAWWNKQGVAMTGNAQVPQNVELLARAAIEAGHARAGGRCA